MGQCFGKALPDLKTRCDHNSFNCVSSCCKSSIDDHRENIAEIVNQHMDIRIAEIYGQIQTMVENYNKNQN